MSGTHRAGGRAAARRPLAALGVRSPRRAAGRRLEPAARADPVPVRRPRRCPAALDAALRLARAEGATLVPVFLPAYR